MTITEQDGTALELGTEPRLETVADDVYAIVQLDGSWGLSNAALIVSEGQSLLVDTFFTAARNARLRALVDAVVTDPPRFLVNTHHHGDHVHGNGWFPESLVIAHGATREALGKLDPRVSARRFSTVDFGETRVTLPSITFSGSLRVHLGGLAVDVISPGTAHCPGNSVVHVPQRGVLVAGDLLLSGCTPTFVGGSARGFLAVLEVLRSLEPEVVVTGHGNVCGPEIIDDTESYVREVVGIAESSVAAGRSPLEAAQGADLGRFSDWLDHERIVGNLHRTMSEVRGVPLDLSAMWSDTTTYLGHGVRSRA